MSKPSPANDGTEQASGTTDDHPPAKDTGILGRDIGKDKREEGAGERVEEERGEEQGNGGQRPLLGREARAHANTANEKDASGEAEREEQEDARPVLARENSLAGEAQRKGGGEPNEEAKENEFKFHNMNLNSYST